MALWENYMNKKPETQETGIDRDTGNKILTYKDKKPTWITKTKMLMPNGKVVSIDPSEQSCEMYNPNKFKIVFENIHPDYVERQNNMIIILDPDNFAFLPHRYFTPWIGQIGQSSGEKFDLLTNVGDQMFKGNKKQSAPEKRKNYGK